MSRSSFARPRNDFEWDYDGRNEPTDVTITTDNPKSDSLSNDVEECNYDRRELRRRLSLDSDQEDDLNSQFAMRVKRSNLRERLQQRMNLQICFVDNGEDDGEEANAHDITFGDENNIDSLENMSNCSFSTFDSLGSNQTKVSHPQDNNTQKFDTKSNVLLCEANCNDSDSKNSLTTKVTKQSSTNCSSLLDSSNKLFSKFKPLFTFSPFSILNITQGKNDLSSNTENDLMFDTFDEYRQHIHNEAKKALKSAKEMAQMQMQLEKEQTKASKILGIQFDKSTTLNDSKRNMTELSKFSSTELKSIVDSINAKATDLNVKLVKLLEERDDLNMEQDSLLIDIEDLTRFFFSQHR